MNPLAQAKRIVLKVGSVLIADEATGEPNVAWLRSLAADAARLRRRGQDLVIVSSGAVALGRTRLDFGRRALTLTEKQAAAACGQSLLMRAWEEVLAPEGMRAAQILLTPDDTEVRRRFVNARGTLLALLGKGVTPVVNENDTVAPAELRYGDNDRLAARVAQMVGADLLVLLSDVDGLYSGDPRREPGARHIPRVARIDPNIEAMAADAAAGAAGSGGMKTKLMAAQIAAAAGCATLIVLGRGASPLQRVEDGERMTLFAPRGTPAAAYKAWIAGALAPQGALTVDDGAAQALRLGKSLLAAGVRSVDGAFGKGDAVVIRDAAGQEIGRGLCRYDCGEASKILGLRSDAIAGVLGYAGGAIVHADDLALNAVSL